MACSSSPALPTNPNFNPKFNLNLSLKIPLRSLHRPQTPPPLTDHQPRFELDSISLLPLGKTGSGSLLPSLATQFPGMERVEKEVVTMTAMPKANKFVPSHLRPRFVAKKEVPSTTVGRGRESGRIGSSPALYGEDVRPKLRSGYEMVMGRRGLLRSR